MMCLQKYFWRMDLIGFFTNSLTFYNEWKGKTQMTISLKPETWVYVAVMDPGGNEQYAGLADGNEKSFIPTFLTKDEAQTCLINMPREKAKKYEIQAILYEELERDSMENGFRIYLLDGQGRILEKADDAGKKM